MAQRYDPDHKAALDALLLDFPGVKPGHMFGHPSYTIGGKVFASLMETGVTIKLPPEHVRTLLEQPNVEPFAPVGKVMRQWVLITVDDAAGYAAYMPYFERALTFVLAEIGGNV